MSNLSIFYKSSVQEESSPDKPHMWRRKDFVTVESAIDWLGENREKISESCLFGPELEIKYTLEKKKYS